MTIKCPYCAEEIQAEAMKCKHCGEWLTIPQETTSAAEADAVNDTPETTQPTAVETGVKQPSVASVGPAGQTIGNKSELHKQPWFTAIMLVFCSPIGLVLMWLYQTKWSVTVKSVITAAISVLLIISVATNGSPTPPPATNDAPAATAPPVASSDGFKHLNAAASWSDDDGTVSITNNDSFTYSNLVIHIDEPGGFSLDQGYVYDAPDLAAGQSATYYMGDFAKTDGTKYQTTTMKLVSLTVDTEDDKGYITGVVGFTSTN